MTNLATLTNWKGDFYNYFLVIADWFTKIVYYKPIKTTINIFGLKKIIIDVVIYYHSFMYLIITNKDLLFLLKFWLSLYYFFSIKKWLSTIFYPQINNQTKKQNSIIEAYLRIFINFNQNNKAKLLLIAKFTNNNSKNANISYTPFKLNCGYHFCIFF